MEFSSCSILPCRGTAELPLVLSVGAARRGAIRRLADDTERQPNDGIAFLLLSDFDAVFGINKVIRYTNVRCAAPSLPPFATGRAP